MMGPVHKGIVECVESKRVCCQLQRRVECGEDKVRKHVPAHADRETRRRRKSQKEPKQRTWRSVHEDVIHPLNDAPARCLSSTTSDKRSSTALILIHEHHTSDLHTTRVLKCVFSPPHKVRNTKLKSGTHSRGTPDCRALIEDSYEACHHRRRDTRRVHPRVATFSRVLASLTSACGQRWLEVAGSRRCVPSIQFTPFTCPRPPRSSHAARVPPTSFIVRDGDERENPSISTNVPPPIGHRQR
jgi:hypothetical protein